MAGSLKISRHLTAAFANTRKLLRDAERGTGPLFNDLMRHTADFDAKQNAQSFKTEGEKSGQPWPVLSPDYAKRKRKAVGNKKTLVFGGQMRRSLVQRDPFRIADVRSAKLVLGTKHRLASIHQLGNRGLVNVRPHHRRGKTGRGFHQVQAFAYRQNLPPRPSVRKSPVQMGQLSMSAQRVLALHAAHAMGRLGNGMKRRAEALRPKADL